MALLAVLLPILMLCVMLALGRLEDLLLPEDPDPVPSETRALGSGGATRSGT
ncbi:hypothetical protein ACIQSP_15140 [Streptomyces nigra]|uniref:hypothetical protein n=1 Tax=Streptomyces nigra TaxID=1827580 RepID=UPI0037F508B5